jgi:hypothetical protein
MNLIDECVIYNKSFKDDLRNHIIKNSSIEFDNGSSATPSINMSGLQSFFPSNIEDYQGAWFPLVVNSDSQITNKVLSNRGSLLNSNDGLTSGRLGIENFISFTPQFQNWTVAPSCNMVSDWILNRSPLPYYLKDGIMCWAQQISQPAPSANISSFPIGSRVQPVGGNVANINYQDRKLFSTVQDNSLFNNQTSIAVTGNITFNDRAAMSLVAGTGQSESLHQAASTKTVEYRAFGSSETETISLFDSSTPDPDADPPDPDAPPTPKYMLWIADGDYFSYYADKAESDTAGEISRSYISPSLWSTYNQIYHMLSIKEIKKNEGKNIRRSRILKKIASILSTSPYATDDCISFLASPDIQTLVESCAVSGVSGTDNTIGTVREIVKLLHNKFGLLRKTFSYNNNNTLKNNFITNNKSLISKIIDKYGCKLQITAETSLSYGSLLRHGDNINIVQAYQTLCAKGLYSTDVINNQTISLNQIVAQTALTANDTKIQLTVNSTNGGNRTTPIPLYDIALEEPGLITLNVLMKDTTDKAGGTGQNLGSPDNYIFRATKKPNDGRTGGLSETEIQFGCLQGIENSYAVANIAQFQSTLSCLWQKIRGPCLKFDDQNKSSNAIGSNPSDSSSVRFETSSYIDPGVYVYSTGEYEIQCTFVTPYGTFIKRKVFYVVDGNEFNYDRLGNATPNPNYGYYYEDGTWKVPPAQNSRATNSIIVNRDKLKVKIASLKNVVLHKHGIFWPIQTDHHIERAFAGSDVKDGLKEKYKFVFQPNNQANFVPKDTDSSLRIKYTPQNTVIKLDTIILQNIRNNTDQCKKCLSVCQPNAEAIPSVSFSPGSEGQPAIRVLTEAYVRAGKQPDGFTLNQYIKLSSSAIPIKSGTATFGFPEISLDYAPPLRSYGGYDSNLTQMIGINLSGNPSPQYSLPSVTGYPLDYVADGDTRAHKACYQIPIAATGYIPFKKGLFHPASGFFISDIPSNLTNRTSVLKFNPGARETYNFIGPGIFNFNSSVAGSGTGVAVKPIIYQSSIALSISPSIQPETDCSDPARAGEATDTANKLHKEFMDQQIKSTVGLSGAPYRGCFHGYRLLEGGQEKVSELSTYSPSTPVNDEFGFDINKSSCNGSSSLSDNESSTFYYRFATNGPNYEISNTGLALKTKDLTIKDIEVKLNFLNYINPKNLVVWLDVSPCAAERKRMAGTAIGGPNCPLANATSQFMDQTFPATIYGQSDVYGTRCSLSAGSVSGSMTNQYINHLVNLNSVNASIKPLKLALLNQDYIQNNKYNLSLTFSDSASKYNTLFDENKINPSGINRKQNIVRNNHSIQPTITATGFNDIDSVVYKNIIRINKLNITNNSFSKFAGLSLFKTPPPEETSQEGSPPNIKNLGPTFDSSTTFTLNIMVLDEPEEMMVYDNIVNNEFITNFTSTTKSKTSSNIYNSLCSWELVLHTGKTKKLQASITNDLFSFGTSDVLGLLDYTNEPKIPGYNFISYVPSGSTYISYFDAYPSGVSLVPRVNQNAPYVYINDSTLCQSAESILSGSSTRVQPPRFPVESLMLILAGILGGGVTGSLVGLMSALTVGFNAGYQGLFDFFYALREAREREGRQREIYAPDYDHYSFGSPEKTVLNVSRDGGIWYKLEASIFKYKNTPALYGNNYKFIRLKRGNIPLFSEFKFDTVYGINQLVDDNMLPTPYPLPDLALTPSASPSTSLPPTPSPSPLSPSQIVDRLLSYQSKVSQLNATLGYQKCFFDPGLQAKITAKKIIIIRGSLAYNIFHINDVIPYYKAVERDSTTAPSTTTILNKALIIKNNKEYTVLELDTDISLYDVIACNGDTLLVFKDKHASQLNEDPFGVWGLEKAPLVSEPPDINHSTIGLGSYGDGSPFTQKNTLSYKLQYNKLYTIHQIFNNRENDKIKKAAVNLKLGTTLRAVGNDHGFYGYGYTNRELRDVFEDKYNNIINKGSDLDRQDSIDYILYQLTNSTSNIEVNGYTFMFLKSATFTDSVFTESGTNHKFGEIIVAEDLVKRPLIEKISSSDVTLINNRISTIESKTYNQSIEDKIGSTADTDTDSIIAHASLRYLEKHLNALPYDNIDCYKKNSVNANGTYTATLSSCPKKKTNKALNDLYTERSTLLQTLEIDKLSASGVVPLQRFSVSGSSAGPVFVNLSGINHNLFWINIDPKQSCSIAEEMCPKVLKSTTYNCIPLTETTIFVHANNNICTEFLSKQQTQIADGGVVDVKITNPVGNSYRGYQYVVPTGVVEAKKTELQTQYPSIFGWTKFTRNRTFSINTDKNLDGVWNGTRDILVKVTEEYDLGLPQHMASSSYVPTTTDSSADTRSVPGIPKCVPAGPGGLEGRGLLTSQNTRVPYTRVYNIFNLDSTDTLRVQFRKMPRQLRGVDLSNTVYRYGRAGQYRQTNPGNPPSPSELDVISGEGSLNNDFYIWKCIERDYGTNRAIDTTLPDFLKLQNEMAYRAFYGSIDGIENKSRTLQSLYAWELIPYEYFTRNSFAAPPPPPSPP